MSVDLRGIRQLVDAEIDEHWDGPPIQPDAIALVLIILNNNLLLRDDVQVGDVEQFRARVRRARTEGLGHALRGDRP